MPSWTRSGLSSFSSSLQTHFQSFNFQKLAWKMKKKGLPKPTWKRRRIRKEAKSQDDFETRFPWYRFQDIANFVQCSSPPTRARRASGARRVPRCASSWWRPAEWRNHKIYTGEMCFSLISQCDCDGDFENGLCSMINLSQKLEVHYWLSMFPFFD